jgi:hypothetical protein
MTCISRHTLNDRLIDYLLFYVPLKNFWISLIWRCHHCRWRAKNLDLCSALRAFEQGGIFIVPHLLWHETSVFPVSSEGPPPNQSPLTTCMGCGGPILTRILTGAHVEWTVKQNVPAINRQSILISLPIPPHVITAVMTQTVEDLSHTRKVAWVCFQIFETLWSLKV